MNKHLEERRMTDRVPEWEAKYVSLKMNAPKAGILRRLFSVFETSIDKFTHPRSIRSTQELLACVDLLIDTERLGKDAAVIGCGPKPEVVCYLATAGYHVTGVEPVSASVREAREYLGGVAHVIQGTAESVELASESQALVLLENVLEHVDSVDGSLKESYRILKPGGVLFVRTTNRMRFSITGINWEFTTRFFNWFPPPAKGIVRIHAASISA
jgi:2-polyprenyl-3-methyl-5-hydroxy-6-metoxy-1,4-benzoquinol methylase